MIDYRDRNGETPSIEERDPVLGRTLRSLDPGTSDPTYWFRFRSRVMSSVACEMGRRRMLADLTVSDLVVSWARTLVPAAVAAAVVAAFLVLQDRPASPIVPMGVEEQLAEGLDGAPIPRVLTSEDQSDAGGVVFASEAY